MESSDPHVCSGGAAVHLDGRMVDLPVIQRATRIGNLAGLYARHSHVFSTTEPMSMTLHSQLSASQLQEAKPIREGLFLLDPPALLGSTCSACGTRTFPPRDFCPACLADGPHPVRPLARSGTV